MQGLSSDPKPRVWEPAWGPPPASVASWAQKLSLILAHLLQALAPPGKWSHRVFLQVWGDGPGFSELTDSQIAEVRLCWKHCVDKRCDALSTLHPPPPGTHRPGVRVMAQSEGIAPGPTGVRCVRTLFLKS